MTRNLSFIKSDSDSDDSTTASSSVASSPGTAESARKRACTACHIRKKRCDAGLPVCRQCVRLNTTCCYVPSTTSAKKQERQLHKRARKAFLAAELARNRHSLADGHKRSTTPQQNINRDAIKAELEKILENASLPSVLQPSPPRSDSSTLDSEASTPALSPYESSNGFSFFENDLSSNWSRHERRPAMNINVAALADQARDLTMSPMSCSTAIEPISLPPFMLAPTELKLTLSTDYNNAACAFAVEEHTVPETVWNELGVSHINKTLSIDELLLATFDANSDLLQSIFSTPESVSVSPFTVDDQIYL